MTTNKTVKYSQLVKAGNFVDSEFEKFVREWMRRQMPCFPIGLLDTDNAERWELQPAVTHAVKELDVKLWVCPACDDQHTSADAECCHDDDDESIPLEEQIVQGYAIINENTGDFVHGLTDYAWRDVEPVQDREVVIDGDEVYLWDDEGDANEAANWCDQAYDAHGDSDRYGFPWAHSYAFLPEDFVSDAALKGAGFTVATYTGGSGSKYDQTFRLAGIDGGGYGFAGHHYGKLVALWAAEKGWTVSTVQGAALVDMDERPDLERLAEVGKSEA